MTLVDAHLWNESQNGPSFLPFLTQGSLLCTEPAPWACFLLREEWRALVLACSSLLCRPQAMRSYYACFLRISPPPFLQPLLLCNCSGSQDSWNLTSWGAIFNFSTHHSWGLGLHTGASPATFSSSQRMQTENQCLCLEWRGQRRRET